MKLFHIGLWDRYVYDPKSMTKLFKVMRLTVFFLAIYSLHVADHTSAQITYQGKNVSIYKVLEVIRIQGGICIAYNEDDLQLAKPITVSLENSSVKEALNEIFKDQPLTYSIVDKTVFVIKKSLLVKNLITGATVQVERNENVTATNSFGDITMEQVGPQVTLALASVNNQSIVIQIKGLTESDLMIMAYSSGNPLNYIKPPDIDSIDMLKDADAAVIYRSKRGNGVILIVTKKSKSRLAKMNLDLQIGWDELPVK